RCGQLPPTRFEIVTVPLTYVADDTKTIDELTVLGGNTPDKYTTFGLTTVRFSHDTEIDLKIVEDVNEGRACGSATVKVTLSMQPVIVYAGRELARTPCAHDATFSHELKHVAAFRKVLKDSAGDLKGDLSDAIGTSLRRSSDRHELERAFNAQIKAYLSVFISQWQREMNARQDAVDTEDEKARVAG